MQFTQIKETCLYTSDLQRAEKFYAEVLGLPKFASSEGRHVFFKAGSSMLLIFNPEETATDTSLPQHDARGRQHIAFEVVPENYEVCKEALTRKGVEIIQEETWGRGKKSFYFRDPDGHLLEIVEQGMWD